jgi:uncharacterized membrane protein YhaH (DUF805 family)
VEISQLAGGGGGQANAQWFGGVEIANNFTVWDGFVSGWKNYFNFSDRARRTEYWGWQLFNFIFGIGLLIINYMLFGTIESFLSNIWSLATFIPGLAISVRRLHDIDKSGWNILWAFTIIGAIPLLIWTCQDSHAGHNKYGKCPKYSGDAS